MKQNYFRIVAVLIALSLFACKKDTEFTQEPTGTYVNADNLLAAVDALYHTGAPSFYGECSMSDVPAAAIGGYFSGFFETEAAIETQLYNHCRQFSFDGMANYIEEIWNPAYKAIGICNEIIENAGLTPGLSNEQKSHCTAEARFFRAFNYFYLVRSFGEVPLVSRGILNDDKGKSTLPQIYESITSDLNRAITELPDIGFAENGFRISRPAAQTLLADVYLTMSGYPLRQNSYELAAKIARQIIEGNNHALIQHGGTSESSAYNILRTRNDNKESVYTFKPSGGASLSALCLSKEAGSWGVIKINTVGAYCPTQSFLNIYEYGVDMRIGEQQLFYSFVKYEKNDRTVIQTFPRSPYFWFDREALFGTGAAQKDIIIYRYAEVLLIAAEAIAMSEGVTAEAVEYLADVRSRAYSKTDRETIIAQLTALDADRFVQEVWLERMREFPLEMKIWPDIQRTRQYPVIASHNATFQNVIGVSNSLNVVFTEKNLLLPTP